MNAPATVIANRTEQNETRRIEQLLALSTRIADALEADIAALEEGRFDRLRSTDPEVAQLCAIYGREVAALKSSGAKLARSAQTVALAESAARLNRLLTRHQSLVTAMRKASEGLVQAVAAEVQKSRDDIAPYRATPKERRSEAPAIVYNKVV
jgi:hypothetical protein